MHSNCGVMTKPKISERRGCGEADAGPGDAIKVYRYNLNLTQAALAEELGILPTHVSEMERGKRGISKAMAKRLSKVLKAPVERFV